MNTLLIIFIALSVANVILQTVKSIVTIKGGKFAGAMANAIAYGLYTVVIIYMNCDLDLWAKVIVTSATNFVGVYIVKYIEEKMRKDKLWKVEATVREQYAQRVVYLLEGAEIDYNMVQTNNNHMIFNIYCLNQGQSHAVRTILKKHYAKYFVTESKNL